MKNSLAKLKDFNLSCITQLLNIITSFTYCMLWEIQPLG